MPLDLDAIRVEPLATLGLGEQGDRGQDVDDLAPDVERGVAECPRRVLGVGDRDQAASAAGHEPLGLHLVDPGLGRVTDALEVVALDHLGVIVTLCTEHAGTLLADGGADPDRLRALLGRDDLTESAQPGAKAALAEIWNAEDREHAAAAAKAFAAQYSAKWPKAAAKITDDLDVLLEFSNYPAEHWVHLRTTNPIESTFATVRLRQRVTKGPGSRAAGIAMAFKLIESAQARWRAVNAPHLVALVRAGAAFERGILIERPEDTNPESGGDQQVA